MKKLVILFTSVLFVLTACSSGGAKIGTLMDETGDLGAYGPPIQNGVDLAVSLINDAGGVNGGDVTVVHADSGTSPNVATEAAGKLIEIDKVGGIVGSLSSGVTMAVAEAKSIPAGMVMISPASTSPAISVLDDNDTVFRTTVSDAAQGVVLARMAKRLGYEHCSTIYVNNPYGEGLNNIFTSTFEEEGGHCEAEIPHEQEQPSYKSEIDKAITDHEPDVIIAMSYPKSAAVYLRELIESGYTGDFMFVDGTKNQEMFDELGADKFEGMMGTAPGAPDSDAKSTFTSLYEGKYGELPTNPFIGEGFDGAILLALAMAKSGTDTVDGDSLRFVANAPGEKVGPGDMAKALELINDGKDIDYVGVAGDQEIDANGDVSNTIEVWTIEDGKITSTGRFESP
ncbi:ABC transporter substrate-binding protein [Chloroflexi bacterium]|nr:ABC transporter substrate-binding protein [Chloroflexota bacterium]